MEFIIVVAFAIAFYLTAATQFTSALAKIKLEQAPVPIEATVDTFTEDEILQNYGEFAIPGDTTGAEPEDIALNILALKELKSHVRDPEKIRTLTEQISAEYEHLVDTTLKNWQMPSEWQKEEDAASRNIIQLSQYKPFKVPVSD